MPNTATERQDLEIRADITSMGSPRETVPDGGGSFAMGKRYVGATEAAPRADHRLRISNSPAATTAATPRIGSGAKKLHSTVINYDDHSVLIRCRTERETIDIQLPRDIISSDLIAIGKPVFVSLHRENGIRYPLVEARQIPAGVADNLSATDWADFLLGQ